MAHIKVDPSTLPAVFVDLDGTILNDDGRVDETSAQLLTELAALKVRVIVATARSPHGALEVIEGLAFDPICVTLNGALVIDMRSDEIVYESILPTENYQRIISAIEEEGLGRSYLALQHRNSFIIEDGFMDNLGVVEATTRGFKQLKEFPFPSGVGFLSLPWKIVFDSAVDRLPEFAKRHYGISTDAVGAYLRKPVMASLGFVLRNYLPGHPMYRSAKYRYYEDYSKKDIA